ncbi:alpha/beta fold hydrolase [Methylobacterium sp. MA0201]
MDFRNALAGLPCPVLVMAGDQDPVSPVAFSETLAASLPPDRVRFERFAECGHGVFGDAPDQAFAVLRDFIQAV